MPSHPEPHPPGLAPARTLLWLFAFLLLPLTSLAQRTTHTRTFRIDGGYAAAITVSPQNNVIVRSGDTPRVTWFNGYERREITTPQENHYRVYESRTGQLWSLYSEGVLLHYRGQWSYHPIPEIRNELQANPMRQLRQLSLLPAEVNTLLILLPDRLIEYDAGTGRVTLLKQVEDTGLGRFQEMTEGQDGGLWVTGINALAHLPGPIRRLSPETEWIEQIHPGRGPTLNLQRPYELPPGHVTTVAMTPSLSRRSVVQVSGGHWTVLPIPGERARQAWRAWDGQTWSYSYNSLFRVLPGDPATLLREPVVGAQFDVSVETNGVFWIASGEGAVRYAPFLWRTPPDLEELQSPVHALLESTNQNQIWMASSEGLLSRSPAGLAHTSWPDDSEILFQPLDAMYEIPGGLLAISTQSRPLLFNPVTRAFLDLQAPFPAPWRFIGQFLDRTLCVYAPQPFQGSRFWKFDGREFTPLPWESLAGFNLPGDEVTLFYQTSRGDAWIGTDAGLVLIRFGDQSIQFFGPQPNALPERILCLQEVGEDRLWCGTARGIYEFRGQEWEHLHSTGERVNAITRGADASIWVATSGGILRHLDQAWIRYAPSEGLPSSAIYALLRDRANRLWAATGRGVARFHPDADPDPPRVYPPAIVGTERPSTQRPTTISFAALDKWDYCPPSELLFAYRLDEGPWSGYSNITAQSFQNLSSGEHHLEIRAMDKAGNPSLETSSLAFTVIVPWFRDPRLIGVSAIGLLAVLFFAAVAVNKHLQLKRSYAQAEQIVLQRTRELEKASQELLHSQKMKAIGTMAAGIAHDFNNILSIIKGSAQIIEANPRDQDKIRRRVNRIQTVVEQGASIVRALLGLGRLNERELTEIDLPQLLQDTRRLLSDRIPDAVQIEVRPGESLTPIRASREVLQQILMNLILNAVDAVGRAGKITLSASPATQPPPDPVVEAPRASSYIILAVADTGCGIPPDVLPRIFEPFYTTKAFSSRRGTGLGLSMVYELAKGLNYGLSVTSHVGTGTTFNLIIPIPAPTPPGGTHH